MEAFLEQNGFARALARRMREETGNDFYDWVDHLTLPPDTLPELEAAGFREERAEARSGPKVMSHPRALMPRVVVKSGGGSSGVTAVLAIKAESLIDFVSRHGLAAEIEGEFGAGLRRSIVAAENRTRLEVVERLGYRGLAPRPAPPRFAALVVRASELWRRRKRDFADDAEGIKHALDVQKAVVELVGADIACELFFAEERSFWEFRNRAARVQKRRQDSLGLGWANHDHHTFRCSRRFFADVVEFFAGFGFSKRERYYAGAEAGWGAQIMEQAAVGIVVFADVDLMPGEIAVDFSTQRLPVAPKLGTVGLWCGLHGDSLLQAGMHHLEARFDFPLLRSQLAVEGISTMKPFSDFQFLKQAFTEGEIWPVNRARAEKLLAEGMISAGQFEVFIRDGAIGSHLENLQRKGGFKGFNQKSVSAIIAATDPRTLGRTASA